MTDHGSRLSKLAALAEAAKLVAGGKVGEATDLIQRTLVNKVRNSEVGATQFEQRDTQSWFPENISQVFKNFRNDHLITKKFKTFDFQNFDFDQTTTEDKQFIELSFENKDGNRDYKLFIPKGYSGLRPLVVMLHGCTQSADDFATGTRMNELAQQDGIYVVYPKQTRAANAQKCWNWFETKDQGRERGESGIIAGLTKAVIAEHPVDPKRVYIAGLSAGGAAAANIARAYPDIFAGVGIHSGLAAGCAKDLSSALLAMRAGAPGGVQPGGDTGFGTGQPIEATRIPTIVFHGEGDVTVNPRNGEEALAQAGIRHLAATEEKGTRSGGRSYTRTLYRNAENRVQVESWRIAGAGHAWSGGSETGSYTDPLGPDASRAMLDFFAQHRLDDGSF